MRIAIIGAGKMGRWFAKFFLGEGFSVIVSDKNKEILSKIKQKLKVETSDNITAVKKADQILLCVPLYSLEDVLREIHSHVQSNQVVMDICSIKEFPVKAMHEYVNKGITLGTHPMFGPTVKSIKGQNFILTPTDERERSFAKTFKQWLEERQVRVSILSPKKHDKLMSMVLGFSHFLGLVISDTLLSYTDFAETKKVAGPTYKKLLTLAESVVSQDSKFYAYLQMKLPEVEKIENLFCQKSMELLKVVKERDETSFASKMNSLRQSWRKQNHAHITIGNKL